MKKILLVVENKRLIQVIRNFLRYLGLPVRVLTPTDRRLILSKRAPEFMILDAHKQIDQAVFLVEEICRTIPGIAVLILAHAKSSRLQGAAGRKRRCVFMTEKDSLLRLYDRIKHLRRSRRTP